MMKKQKGEVTIKDMKQVISNPFSLYYSFNCDKPALRKENQKATREFTKCWKSFVMQWRQLQLKHEELGASDTAAREKQIEWIKKHSTDIF
jgi:hypothetical protein